MKDYYLPINLNFSGFQFIHIDAFKGFGVVCKFQKTSSNNTFNIIDMKLILATFGGEKYYEVTPNFSSKKITPTQGRTYQQEVEKKGYGFEIGVELTNNPYQSSNLSEMNDNSFLPSIYLPHGIDKKCIIDLHIDNEKEFFDEITRINDLPSEDIEKFKNIRILENQVVDAAEVVALAATFGTRFCKFYIV